MRCVLAGHDVALLGLLGVASALGAQQFCVHQEYVVVLLIGGQKLLVAVEGLAVLLLAYVYVGQVLPGLEVGLVVQQVPLNIFERLLELTIGLHKIVRTKMETCLMEMRTFQVWVSVGTALRIEYSLL